MVSYVSCDLLLQTGPKTWHSCRSRLHLCHRSAYWSSWSLWRKDSLHRECSYKNFLPAAILVPTNRLLQSISTSAGRAVSWGLPESFTGPWLCRDDTSVSTKKTHLSQRYLVTTLTLSREKNLWKTLAKKHPKLVLVWNYALAISSFFALLYSPLALCWITAPGPFQGLSCQLPEWHRADRVGRKVSSGVRLHPFRWAIGQCPGHVGEVRNRPGGVFSHP